MGFFSFLFKNNDRKVDDGPTAAEKMPKPGDVFIMPVKDDILGACRVIRNGNPTKRHQKDQMEVTGGGVLVALTAWMGTSAPDISEPKLGELLQKTYGNFNGETEFVWVKKPIPDEFKFIGSLKPTPEELQVNCNTSAGWFWLSSIAKEQYGWDNSKEKRIDAPKKIMIEVGNASCHGCRLLGGWKDGYVWNASEKYIVEKQPNLNEFFSKVHRLGHQ